MGLELVLVVLVLVVLVLVVLVLVVVVLVVGLVVGLLGEQGREVATLVRDVLVLLQ